MRKSCGLVISAILLAPNVVLAENYIPIAPAGASDLLTLGDRLPPSAYASTESTNAATAPVAPLKCATPPTAAALGVGQFVQTTTDLEGAVAAGLPAGSMSASSARKILIQDWMRTARCTATDGQTELVYGMGIRLFASSEGLDVDGDVTLGLLAANSTLNNQNSKVSVTIVGYNDSQLTSLAAGIFGPINVERFATVDGLMKKMIDRTSGLSGTVQRLGVVFPPSSAQQHVLAAFAVQQVASGQSCEATKGKMPGLTPTDAALVASVYQDLEAMCDNSAPGPVARARAAEALGKIRVRI